MTSSSRVEIEKFDGSGDFALWKVKMRAHLGNIALSRALEGEFRLPATMDETKKEELLERAYNTLILSLSDKVLREVIKLKSAAEVWLKLELNLLEKQREMAASGGFRCSCRRCEFEESIFHGPELRDMDTGMESGEGKVVSGLEECMKKLAVRGKEKGYLRASFWRAYCETYTSEGLLKRWARRIPTTDAVAEGKVEAMGSDERVLKVVRANRSWSGGGIVEMERVFKLGRGFYGNIVKQQALKTLLDI